MSETLVIRRATRGGRAIARPPFFRTKSVAILGATKSIHQAPWQDPRWTLVSHTCARQFCQREPDWYFDMHRRECFTQPKGWNKHYYDWLRHLQTPIFMQEESDEIPMAVSYPIAAILSQFRPFFTNHVAYMVALALTEGVQEIGVFGCEYAARTERHVQRGSLQYWLGFAEARGVRIVLPAKHCTLLSYPPTLYGYDSHDEHGKLKGAYKMEPVVRVDKPDGKSEERELYPLGHVPLAKPIEGAEPPNAERAAKFGIDLAALEHQEVVETVEGPVDPSISAARAILEEANRWCVESGDKAGRRGRSGRPMTCPSCGRRVRITVNRRIPRHLKEEPNR